MEKVYEDLHATITKSLEEGMDQSVLTFSAVSALAGLLAEKGLIEYDEFVKAFKENLLEK